MKLTRRYQVLPTYAFCAGPDGCGWYAAAAPEPEINEAARAHARETGHPAHVVSTTQVIFAPERAPAPAGAT